MLVRYSALWSWLRWCVTVRYVGALWWSVTMTSYGALRWYVTVLIGGVLWRCVMVRVGVSVSHRDNTRVGHCHQHLHQQRCFYQRSTPCGPRGCK